MLAVQQHEEELLNRTNLSHENDRIFPKEEEHQEQQEEEHHHFNKDSDPAEIGLEGDDWFFNEDRLRRDKSDARGCCLSGHRRQRRNRLD